VLAAIGGLAITIGAIALVVDGPAGTRGDGGSGGAALEAPPEIRARATTDAITLRWTASGDPDVRYQVTRDGMVLVASQRPTRFTDRDIAPLASYVYEVRAVDAEGETSASVRAVVDVPEPEPAVARVEGFFAVRLEERSHHGFHRLIPERTAEFIFEPTCVLGRCSARWTWVDHPGIGATTGFDGGAYRAETRGELDIPCGSSLPTTTLTLSFRVTKGEVRAGEWLAVRLEGSIREDTPPQFGCVRSTVSYGFTATPLLPHAANVFRVSNEACRFDGTGFLTSDGYVVTNAHVVAGAAEPVVNLNGREVTARVVAFSPTADLAILDVGPTGRATGLELSVTDELGRSWAFGFPNGRSLTQYAVQVVRAVDRGYSLTGRPVPLRGYAFRGNVRHGDSGGPIVGASNDVLGVVTSGVAGRSGFAVGASEVAALIRTVDGTEASTGACYRS
jgi:hypothetical protein